MPTIDMQKIYSRIIEMDQSLVESGANEPREAAVARADVGGDFVEDFVLVEAGMFVPAPSIDGITAEGNA